MLRDLTWLFVAMLLVWVVLWVLGEASYLRLMFDLTQRFMRL